MCSHLKDCVVTMMATEATRQQSLNYGCVVEDPADHTVLHYVEKPETHVSTSINCGVYIFNKEVFPMLKEVFKKKQASVQSGASYLSQDFVMFSM